jgi:F-type H+-transporting ATPase subunit epsilon
MASEKNFDLEIICPDRTFFKGEAFMIELNTTEGYVGIYKRHIPMTMILEPGLVVIKDGEQEQVAALHEGFIEVLPEKIRIMAEAAEWPDEIDRNRAEEARVRAERRMQMQDPNINLARAEMALHRALTRIEASEKGRA